MNVQAPEPGAPLRPGDPTRVGPYRLERLLGSGGMGVVFLGRTAQDRPVAVKLIRDELRHQPDLRRRFSREVDAARRVASFCTARVLDADPNAPSPYLVTEYVPGPSLQDYVTELGPLSVSEVDTLAVGIATGLTAIHAAGLAHGDLTPRNVLLSPLGPKVIDFGLAALHDGMLSTTDGAFGTPGWLPPERLKGGPPHRDGDVYCWGRLVLWAATGGQQAAPHTQPSTEPGIDRLSARLAGFVTRALHESPRMRPTARELMLCLVGGGNRPQIRAAVAPVTRPLTPRAAPTAPDMFPPPHPPVGRQTHVTRKRLAAALAATAVIAIGISLYPHDAAPEQAAGGSRVTTRPPATTGSPAATPAGTTPATDTHGAATTGAAAGGDRALSAGTARDGPLEFTVGSIRCGAPEVDVWLVVRRAQGIFCLVHVKITNRGSDDALVPTISQRLIDEDGHVYKPDNWSLLYPDTVKLVIIQPGEAKTGSLVYDVPAGTKIRQIRVYGAIGSAGTVIQVPT
jgi:predicted Ser/Thr protein kinase